MENALTQKRLQEVLDYNQDNGTFVWVKTLSHRAIAGNQAKSKMINGYMCVSIDGTKYLAHRLAWLYVYGYMPESYIDHINRIKTDNRIVNLRETSMQCNLRNSKVQINNASGVRGIYWSTKRKLWCTQIKVSQKMYYLGGYDDFDEAVCVRLAIEQCLGWRGCDSNSSAYQYYKKNIFQLHGRTLATNDMGDVVVDD